MAGMLFYKPHQMLRFGLAGEVYGGSLSLAGNIATAGRVLY